MPEAAVWMILFAPLASFLAIGATRPWLGPLNRMSGYITLAAISVSFVLSLVALSATVRAEGHHLGFPSHEWLTVGALTIRVGVVMDSLTAVMVVVVTGVSLLVQLYGLEYMKHDVGYARYYAAMSLFTASMLGLVMASNLVLLFVFWELVGLCSYLLIGHWHDRPAAAAAAKKAFVVTRFGDLWFLISIVWVYQATGSFEIRELHAMAATGALGGATLTWIALGIFAGAAGKSGQFPLHVWLPDAMEGPTPVSALIHAATMVAAGVFLVARMYPLFEASAAALTVVAWVGAFTAVFAATMALVANDMKRVMAYSTVSQLGYMMLAVGVGAVGAAIFHLVNHAFFKALLFLGAGSIQHATGTYDIRYLGGLRRTMPVTFATLTIAALSLSGIPVLSGFWSKDAILEASLGTDLIWGGPMLFLAGLVAAFLTGVYVFRMILVTFRGEYRGGAAREATSSTDHAPQNVHLHESSWRMLVPLAVLAVPAVLSGVLDSPVTLWGLPSHWMTSFLGGHAEGFNPAVAVASVAAAGSGVLLAFLIYGRTFNTSEVMARRLKPVHSLLANRYYVDWFYEDVLVRRVLYGGIARGSEWFDANVLDRVGNTLGWLGRNLGRAPAQLQSGQVQAYGAVIAGGLVVLMVGLWVWG